LYCIDSPVLDVSRFYRIELARAISDIRQDFEILSQSQVNELEEYYRIKTEEIRAEIESENERKRLLANEGLIDSIDKNVLTALKDNQNDLISLQTENKQLQSQFDAIVDDLEKIQDEYLQERYSYDQEFGQLRQQITEKQDIIDNLLQNTISLRFEMSTYRRLLDVEEQHINKIEQGQPLLNSASSNQQTPNPILSDLGTKKMTVQKTARGKSKNFSFFLISFDYRFIVV
jgi:chromosome segregation ATPase